MKIGLGSDHAGYDLKEVLRRRLDELGHGVHDFGTSSTEPVDYPLFIVPVAEAVARGELERGIVLGGSGNGEAIAANRIRGVRCGLAWNVESARLARAHNDANVLSLGGRMVNEAEALAMLDVFLATPFEGGRHVRRLALLEELAEGSVTRRSAHSFADTLDRLRAILRERGLAVFAEIDQAAAARENGLDLPPTMLLLFGNPKAGTPIMAATPLAALDLPLKILVRVDGPDVLVCCDGGGAVARRHGVDAGSIPRLDVAKELVERVTARG